MIDSHQDTRHVKWEPEAIIPVCGSRVPGANRPDGHHGVRGGLGLGDGDVRGGEPHVAPVQRRQELHHPGRPQDHRPIPQAAQQTVSLTQSLGALTVF